MLRPSYAELMDILNKEGDGNNVKSRYTIVIAAAKRARQLIDGHEPIIDEESIKVDKAMSIAVEEMYQGKIEVVPEGEGTVLNLKKHEDEVEATEEVVPEENDDFDDVMEDEEFEDDLDLDIDSEIDNIAQLLAGENNLEDISADEE